MIENSDGYEEKDEEDGYMKVNTDWLTDWLADSTSINYSKIIF